ncbi:MAG: DUF882 domain-containing protein [Nitrospira sp.]|nr:DUF882 domain-containing protein [Nitrospira sp.]
MSVWTSQTYKQGTTTLGTLTYTYDGAGNRLQTGGTFARTNLPPALTSATYNANNQQTAFGTATETYDLNGNLATSTEAGVTTTYTWNARNQLTGISSPSLTASFTYDSFGRRTGKTINGTTTNFVYDGLNPVQEKNGATVTANLLTGLGIDEFFTRTDGVGVRALLPDALGSTIVLSDNTGALQTQYTSEPFGFTTQTGTASTSNYKYTGREDDGTGLYYYRARYYQPRLQRFIAEDPIGFVGGDVNLYGYAKGNPLILLDPIGLRVLNPNNYPVSPDVLAALEELNRLIGCDKDIVITGGNRDPSSPLGAGSRSTHAKGLAADITVPGQTHLETANQAAVSGLFGGVGWYQEGYRGPKGEGPHTHVDLRSGPPARWGYPATGPRMPGFFPPYPVQLNINSCRCTP